MEFLQKLLHLTCYKTQVELHVSLVKFSEAAMDLVNDLGLHSLGGVLPKLVLHVV